MHFKSFSYLHTSLLCCLSSLCPRICAAFLKPAFPGATQCRAHQAALSESSTMYVPNHMRCLHKSRCMSIIELHDIKFYRITVNDLGICLRYVLRGKVYKIDCFRLSLVCMCLAVNTKGRVYQWGIRGKGLTCFSTFATVNYFHLESVGSNKSCYF